MRTLIGAALLIASLTVNVCYAADKTPVANDGRITGIYSNMEYNEEGGDVLGMEVFLVSTNKGYFVVFQSSEGEPYVPVVVKARVSKNLIGFSVPESAGYSGLFRGKITPDGITGSFSDEDEVKYTLKKKKSYWQ